MNRGLLVTFGIGAVTTDPVPPHSLNRSASCVAAALASIIILNFAMGVSGRLCAGVNGLLPHWSELLSCKN